MSEKLLKEYEEFCHSIAPGPDRQAEVIYRLMENVLAGEENPNVKFLHGVVGRAGEVGEALDSLKRFLIYGKRPDRDNILEECGDELWYIVRTLEAFGLSLEDAIKHNMKKLKKRYHEGKFSEAQALGRADKTPAVVVYGEERGEDYCSTCEAGSGQHSADCPRARHEMGG